MQSNFLKWGVKWHSLTGSKRQRTAAEKKKAEKPKNEYGNQGAGQGAYKDAQEALDEEDKKGGKYASAD